MNSSQRGRGRGRGRPVPAPATPHAPAPAPTVRNITTTVQVPTLPLPVTVTRQVLDRDDEADFDPEQHRPSESYLERLRRADLTAPEHYEDPYEETGRKKMRPTKQEEEEFKRYVTSQQFRQHIERFSTNSDLANNRQERMRTAYETTAAGANVRLALQGDNVSTTVDRLTALDPAALDLEDRNRFLPPPTINDRDRISTLSVKQIATNDLRQLLKADYLPHIDAKERRRFLAMPCINTILRDVQPLMLVHEYDKQHYNIVEIVDDLVAAGCKFVSVTRLESMERLADVLDTEFYAPFLKHDKRTGQKTLVGGHEHYDARNMRTRFVLLTMRCVLKPKLQTEEKQAIADNRREGIAKQMAIDDDSDTFAADDDLWDDIVDHDDDYTGGNDLYNPASHYIYCATFVFVEAVDCECANEALEPVATNAPRLATAAPAVIALDDSEIALGEDARDDTKAAPGATASTTTSTVTPDGLGALSEDSARVLVGKFKEATFRMHCQGTHPFYPLCFRGVKFSTGAVDE